MEESAALTDDQILNIIANELNNSVGGDQSDGGSIQANREAALATYLGQLTGDEVEGRSKVVSTDVADAIEWIMPEIVKAFTQNNDVVTFDASSAKDERQAELESKYVYDILMKDNDGFIIIHQFIKDCLMQKNGFIKCFYENIKEKTTETYTGLSEQELQMVLADASIDLTSMTETQVEGQPKSFDVTIERVEDCSKTVVLSVPPEEMRVNRDHNSVDLKQARFTAHVSLKTAGDLVAEGHDPDFVDSIPSSPISEEWREYRFEMQGEVVQPIGQTSCDPTQRLIEVSECFLDIDLDGSGKARRMKITVAGGDAPTVILGEPEEYRGNPFVSSTAILMSHKLFGLSIYDRLKEIQAQKTALWRNIFDNIYLQNNQRTIVLENQVNIDDLLVSRPGGIIRAKTHNAVQPYQTPPLSGDTYKMMDYLDKVRTGRAGVSPEGAVQDSQIGDRIGSEGLEKMMTQKEELVGLMIRVIAETGIKPLCYKIREQVVKHQDVVKDYKFRGDWVPVNPASWKKRSTTTVRVGTGSGDRKAQAGAISQILAMQEKMLANPSQTLVKEEQVFKAIDDFAKTSGLPGAAPYFLDPESKEGQANKQAVQKSQQEQQKKAEAKEQAELQFQQKIASVEEQKAQITGQNNQLKNQVDTQKNQLTLQKQSMDAENNMLKQQLAEAEALISSDEKDAELVFKYWSTRETLAAQKEMARNNQKEVSDE